MGLGKTLQAICIMASDHFERNREYLKTANPACFPLPSLVVCPTTVVGHWYHEISKFCEEETLKPLMYVGDLKKRARYKVMSLSLNLFFFFLIAKGYKLSSLNSMW